MRAGLRVGGRSRSHASRSGLREAATRARLRLSTRGRHEVPQARQADPRGLGALSRGRRRSVRHLCLRRRRGRRVAQVLARRLGRAAARAEPPRSPTPRSLRPSCVVGARCDDGETPAVSRWSSAGSATNVHRNLLVSPMWSAVRSHAIPWITCTSPSTIRLPSISGSPSTLLSRGPTLSIPFR